MHESREHQRASFRPTAVSIFGRCSPRTSPVRIGCATSKQADSVRFRPGMMMSRLVGAKILESLCLLVNYCSVLVSSLLSKLLSVRNSKSASGENLVRKTMAIGGACIPPNHMAEGFAELLRAYLLPFSSLLAPRQNRRSLSQLTNRQVVTRSWSAWAWDMRPVNGARHCGRRQEAAHPRQR